MALRAVAVAIRLFRLVSELKRWTLNNILLIVCRLCLVHIINVEQEWVYISSITLAEFEISKVSAKNIDYEWVLGSS